MAKPLDLSDFRIAPEDVWRDRISTAMLWLMFIIFECAVLFWITLLLV